MKKLNLTSVSFRSPVTFLSFLIVVFFSVSYLSSCKKDTDMKDSTMKDSTMNNKSMDKMGKDKTMDNKMNNMQDNKMTDMMNKMNEMKMTGNTDVDFVNMMIIHHQGAIDMASSEVSSGKNADIKSFANDIIKDQTKEIAAMKSWLDKNKDKKSATGDNSRKLMESMNSMMNPDMKMSGDADKDFLTMMILHHQGAIDMSGVEINNGTDPEIKKMSQEIITKQKAEIEQMKKWLNTK